MLAKAVESAKNRDEMVRIQLINRIIFLAWIIVSCTACKARPSPRVNILLASSLLPLENIIRNSIGVQVDLMFLSSSAIAKQIEQGAPCDLAVLADEQWQEYLLEKNLVETTSHSFAENALVLVSNEPHATTSVDKFFADFAASEKIIIGDPDFVPLGVYTKEALERSGLFSRLSAQFVRASSALQASNMLKERVAQWAVLYRSDAKASGIFIVSPIDSSLHRPIRYPVVKCKSAHHPNCNRAKQALLSQHMKQAAAALGF